MNTLPPSLTTPSRAGFTLVELLVVISIIALLAALILPVAARMQDTARASKCVSNLRQVYMAVQGYAQDNDGNLLWNLTAGHESNWIDTLGKRLDKDNDVPWKKPVGVLECPSAGRDGAPVISGGGLCMNDNPGYPDVIDEGWRRNWQSGWWDSSEGASAQLKLVAITHPAGRYLAGDGFTWDIGVEDLPGAYSPGALNNNNFAAIHRHGQDRSNVLFFDGHAAVLNPEEVYYSIVDPGHTRP